MAGQGEAAERVAYKALLKSNLDITHVRTSPTAYQSLLSPVHGSWSIHSNVHLVQACMYADQRKLPCMTTHITYPNIPRQAVVYPPSRNRRHGLPTMTTYFNPHLLISRGLLWHLLSHLLHQAGSFPQAIDYWRCIAQFWRIFRLFLFAAKGWTRTTASGTGGDRRVSGVEKRWKRS